MIEMRQGDVLSVDTGIIVHGCNCRGVMGAGIALTIKNRYPDVYTEYKLLEKTRGLRLGGTQPVEVGPDKWIVNAMTQDGFNRHGNRQASYDAISDAFEDVAEFASMLEAKNGKKLEIVFPMIGAGLGGGNWRIIETIIDEVVPDAFKKALYIYRP